ncbi:MAG TPA: LLM class F420-dependent oxidoreductase, partial [Acidimicrobiia bacterium]
KPHIPFWIAGGGEKVTLRIAARYGAYSNFGVELGTFIHKSELLRGHCDDVGTDFDSIVRSANFNILCAATEAEVADKKAWLVAHLKTFVPEERATRFAAMYDYMSGTPDQVAEKLRLWEKEGMTYAIVNFADVAYDTSSLDLFAREVIPALA